MASFCSLIGKCRDRLAGWSFGMADVNVGCACASLGTWSLGTSNFLTGRWVWRSLVVWVTRETVALFSFRSPPWGCHPWPFPADGQQYVGRGLFGIKWALGPWEWQHFSDSSLGVSSVCLQEQVNLGWGKGDFSLWWRGDPCPEWDSLPTRVSVGALIYRRASSLFLDSSYE